MRTRPFVLAFLVCLALVGVAFALGITPARSNQPHSSPRLSATSAPSTAPRTHLPGVLPVATGPGAVLVPQQVAPLVVSAIDVASSVDLEVYELGNPTVIAALIAAHDRGIPVRVILAAFEAQSVAAASTLRDAGVAVAMMAVPGGIDHVKLLVTNQAVITGGVNLGASSGDTIDMDLSLPSADVAAATRVFDTDWAAVGGHGAPASGTPSSNNTVSSNNTGPFVTGPAIQTALLGLFAHASRSCVVLANFLSDHTIRSAIVSAIRRGVRIDVVLNPTAYGSATAVETLRHAGALVVLAPRSPYLHAKVAACGSAAVVGSANFSYDGMHVNHELDAVVSGPLARAVTARAERVFAAAS